MYIGQIDKEMVKIQSGQMRPDQQAFCKEMSYDNPKEPYGVIGEILTKPFQYVKNRTKEYEEYVLGCDSSL